ncbi:uncharacterized protein LOC129571756, partial [Sitodiplosis mosellana]|uniref:uncharacterized protein LOC129571756 n=1 Tax=Sitodiplosis mosellana TaxID=263140 RepID=UPI0024441F4E
MKSRIAHFKEIKQQQTKEICDLKKQIEQLTNLSERLTSEKNVAFAEMNDKQNEIIKSLVHKVKPRDKYPETIRKFSFTMHYHSPRAYEFLRETFGNHLPHSGTIRSWYVNSDLNTAPNVINEHCLNVLRKKVMDKAERGEKLICGILFDEVSIRKHIQWSNKDRKLVGYSSIENRNVTEDESEGETIAPDVANQALVFMVVA